jgi:hypothetical protein
MGDFTDAVGGFARRPRREAIILDGMALDHLKAMRAPGESYSDVIIRLAKGEAGSRD